MTALSESRGLSDREIVRAAREIIAEAGVQGLTMRRLSAELGVALGATYHHVATKHDLLILVGRDLYSQSASSAPDGPWQARLKTIMLNQAAIVGRYPGMAAFMMANVDELPPTDLNALVGGILVEAGFTERGIEAVMSALFFFVIGMCAGGFVDPSAKLLKGRNIHALFEDGLGVMIAGAEARLEEDRKRKRPGRRR
jgi:AcrR family transcriptional regulator